MPDDRCHSFINSIPFWGLIVSKGLTTPPMITGLIEKAIIAIAAGAMSAYVSVKVLEAQFVMLKEQVTSVSNQVDRVNVKVEKLRDDLYIPRAK